MSRGEFYARLEAVYELLGEQRDRIARIEDRVEAPKRFVLDVVSTGWTKFSFFLGAFLIAFLISLLSKHGIVSWPF